MSSQIILNIKYNIPSQALIQHQENRKEELQAEHETALLKLDAQLKQEAQKEEDKYLHSAEQSKQKILQEKQSKLNAAFDASTLNNEHKEQVINQLVTRDRIVEQ